MDEKKVVGYMTRDGVLYVFTDAEKSRAFWDAVGREFSAVGWVDGMEVDAERPRERGGAP